MKTSSQKSNWNWNTLSFNQLVKSLKKYLLATVLIFYELFKSFFKQKCHHFLFQASQMWCISLSNWTSLGCWKSPEDVTLGSRKLRWMFLTIFWHFADQTIKRENNQIIIRIIISFVSCCKNRSSASWTQHQNTTDLRGVQLISHSFMQLVSPDYKHTVISFFSICPSYQSSPPPLVSLSLGLQLKRLSLG